MKCYQKFFYNECIIAQKRDKRPFINEGDTTCPFCLANETSLEKIIDESWKADELFARIVSNRYPITSEEGVKGIHDVIIDTHKHTLHPKDFTVQHWETLLCIIQKRWHSIMKFDNIRLIQVFKNYGENAGASISHSHWQLVALEAIPYTMQIKYQAYNSLHMQYCYLCSKLHIEEGIVIWEDSLWEIWIPPVPQFSYEVWFVPKMHHQHYGQLSLEEIKKLGKLMKYLLQIYHQIEPQYAFNICFMSGDLNKEYPYHFHIKLILRIGKIAGFEIATGCHIMNVAPEMYAEQIKKILKGMYK